MILVQRRFSDVLVSETEVSPTIEAGGGLGGNNLPMMLIPTNQNNAVIGDTEICNTLPAAMGMGGYVPMILDKTVYDASRRHNYKPFTDDVCETVQAHYGTGGGQYADSR